LCRGLTGLLGRGIIRFRLELLGRILTVRFGAAILVRAFLHFVALDVGLLVHFAGFRLLGRRLSRRFGRLALRFQRGRGLLARRHLLGGGFLLRRGCGCRGLAFLHLVLRRRGAGEQQRGCSARKQVVTFHLKPPLGSPTRNAFEQCAFPK